MKNIILALRVFFKNLRLKIEDFYSDFHDMEYGSVYRSKHSQKSELPTITPSGENGSNFKKKVIKIIGRGRIAWVEED